MFLNGSQFLIQKKNNENFFGKKKLKHKGVLNLICYEDSKTKGLLSPINHGSTRTYQPWKSQKMPLNLKVDGSI